MSISENDQLNLGQIEGLLTRLLSMVRSQRNEISSTSEMFVDGGWIYTLVGKDSHNEDTGPAELVYEGRVIETIKRLMEQDEETTHVEIHEGNVG
jgi:hypothetical protein